MTFAIKSSNFDQGLILDVPGSIMKEGTQVTLYGDFHGGPNQLWSQVFSENSCDDSSFQIISALDDNMCLGVVRTHETETLENFPVILCYKTNEHYLTEWTNSLEGRYTIVRLKCNSDFVITNNMDANIVVSKLRHNDKMLFNKPDCKYSDYSQMWYLDKNPVVSDAKPATSCHLTYGPYLSIDKELYQKVMKKHGWTLRNTVRVKEVADSTYFCVVGWGPGGYSGIQQIDSKHRVAIYSMWHSTDERNSNVECVCSGDGVKVESFGGEGTGLKSMKDFWWEIGEEITFIVKGTYDETDGLNQGVWKCSCWYTRSSEDNQILHLMATYSRRGEICPLSNSGFYSFVEDWNRSSNAEGYLQRRCAAFAFPELQYGGYCKILEGNKCDATDKSFEKCNKKLQLNTPSFTKVETGCDAFASNSANVKIRNNKCKFTLETGGCSKYKHATNK